MIFILVEIKVHKLEAAFAFSLSMFSFHEAIIDNLWVLPRTNHQILTYPLSTVQQLIFCMMCLVVTHLFLAAHLIYGVWSL